MPYSPFSNIGILHVVFSRAINYNSFYPVSIYFSILSPEDFEDPEFFITFEKDPQQEEFLQGRMQNNPYNAFDASIGPLMRDVKNKICRDTELLALLEEDTGS